MYFCSRVHSLVYVYIVQKFVALYLFRLLNINTTR